MKRKTLVMMNPREAFEHYEALANSRVYRAWLLMEHARVAPRPVRARAIADAKERWVRAAAWARPCHWHIAAAHERHEKYGMAVAAAFLRAHGWSAEAAHWTLIGSR